MRIHSSRFRRTAVAVLAVALLGGLTVGGTANAETTTTAGTAPAAANAPTPTERVGELNNGTIPAPPTPVKRRPDQRTVVQATALPTATVVPAAGTGRAVPGGGAARTLVLFDDTGAWGWLGEVYAQQTANLASHFGSWTARPVGKYTAGELNNYSAVIYVGSTYDEPVPVAFLDDVLTSKVPVLWMYDNIWQLTARKPDFAAAYGFTWKQFDVSAISEVRYHGTSLTRDTANLGGIMDHVISDPTKVKVLGEAVRPDGTTLPWALRSGNLTYVGEIPFSYVTHDDRYLAFADLLYDVLAPAKAARHRALARIEDVGPNADPVELRAIADYLYSKKVPFSVAVYPRYRDPLGIYTGGRPEDYTLRQRPLVVSALKYMQARGGTLIMHGYTHQYASMINPYDGVSANDFEFYKAHVDASNNVIYDGPVAEDSAAYATNRMRAGLIEFAAAGLPQPSTFEFPHYAGSVTDYNVAGSLFGARYDRGLYFPGAIKGTAPDYSHLTGQFFPYAVRDVYGSPVVPENIGNVETASFNNHGVRLPADMIASAKRNLVVRDGMASFFYHPFLGTGYLSTLVEGIQGLGYTFVPASAVFTG
jgi:uncharacterized protein YdaL